jgi:ribosome maturation factor RimP
VKQELSPVKRAIVENVTAIAERVGRSEGIEIVDVELLGGGGARLLRIFIDRPGGVSLEHCELISRQMGTILDVEDTISGGSYTLEVSSPGLERKLSKPADFERFLGQPVKLLLSEPVGNQRRWEGKLAGFEAGVITLEPAPGREVRVDLSLVEKANLKFEW